MDLSVVITFFIIITRTAILILAISPCFSLRGSRLEALQHERHQVPPAREAPVTGQGANVAEQPLTGGQFPAEQSVLVIHPFQHGVDQKGQDDEVGQH